MLRRVDFGDSGIEYIRSVLSESRTLWRYLTELDLKAGHTLGYFAREFPAATLEQFSSPLLERGSSPEEMIRETNACLFRGVAAYLQGESFTHIAIGASTYMPNDRYPPQFFEYWNLEWMMEHRAQHQRERRAVPEPSTSLVDRYLYQAAGPFSEEQFKILWEFQPFWARKCILTSCGSPQIFKNEVEEPYLRAAAEATEYILLKAYDGDAPLVWSRTKELAERFDAAARGQEVESQEIG